MSVSQSSLSDPKYGYDLVVAVTQASVNAALLQYLAGIQAPEVVVCYVYDNNNNLVQVPYSTLKGDARGSDPFAIPPDADPKTNQDLKNLLDCSYAGGFKARLGLPDVPLANMPPVARLGVGTNAPVTFNLLCSEFQITGFQYLPRGANWISQSQPAGAGAQPWYFSSNVSLNNTTIDPHSPVSPEVQQRIQQLIDSVGADAFSIQKLFLDLDTAMLESSPTIVGIPTGWPVWSMISSIFLGVYLDKLRAGGDPVLAYSLSMKQPDRANMQLGAMARECCGLLDDHGQPIPAPTPQQSDATTLVYLGTTTTTRPVPVPFTWNWVELGEMAQCSGVQAVRRDQFFSYLGGLVNSGIGWFCIDPTVSLTHSGLNYSIRYYYNYSPSPSKFQLVASPAAGGDGFTDILKVSYSHACHDDSMDSMHMSSIHGDFNYNMTGAVAAKGNQIRITLNSQVAIGFNHHELGIEYTDLPVRNYFDKTLAVTYTLGVSADGHLQVTQASNITDSSAAWAFDGHGIMGSQADEVIGPLTNGLKTELSNRLSDQFTGFVGNIANMINSYRGWVFPGASGFVFKNARFSDGLDLVTQVTYADPQLRATTATLSARGVQ